MARALEEGFSKVGVCAPDAVPRGGGAVAGVSGGGASRADGLDGGARGVARVGGGAVARGAVGDHAGRGLHAGGRSAGGAGAARTGGRSSVYAQGKDYHDLVKRRLKRLGRWLVEPAGRRDQGVRRYRAGDGKAAGAGGGAGLAGQAHQSAGRAIWATGSFWGRSSPRWSCRRMRPEVEPLRHLHGLSGHLPDAGLSGALPAGCAALHFLSDHRASRAGGRRSCGR